MKGGSRKQGWFAGTLDRRENRLYININKKTYTLSRLVWFYVLGVWPIEEVHNIDRNPVNNCWDNLRESTRIQNSRNTKCRKDSSIGRKEVTKHEKKYRACIFIEGRIISLGAYKTEQEAEWTYELIARALHKQVFLPV